MTKIIQWFAGFLQDQNQSASSKRLTLYICLFFFYLLIKGSLNGSTINEQILYAVVAIILFCVGAITAEFFKSNLLGKGEGKSQTTTE